MSGRMVTGLFVAGALLMVACGSSGTGTSSGTTHPKQTRTSSTSAPKSTTTTAVSPTTSTTGGSGSGPMVTASLPVVVCQTTTGAPTTTTSLPASVSVSVPASDGQQGNLAVYSDLTGRLMLVGPTVGWTCSGTFGADGSGMMVLTPVGTSAPSTFGGPWHLPTSSATQAIVALESGGSTVQGAALDSPLFSAPRAAVQQDLGTGWAVTSPPQETVVRASSTQVAFQDPVGVAGVGFPS